MKRKHLFPLLGVLIIATLLLLTEFSSTQKKRNQFSIGQRKYTSIGLVKNKITYASLPYRLFGYEDSAIICYDTTVEVISNDFTKRRLVDLPVESGNDNYYVKIGKDFVGGTKASENIIYFHKAGNLYQSSTAGGYINNGTIVKDGFFCTKLILGKKPHNDIFIDSWDWTNNKWQTILKLSEFLKNEIVNCKECFENTLDGNLFAISDNSFGYYFYRSGYILIYKNQSFHLKKTIVDYPFILYKQKAVILPGGFKASKCEAAYETFVQLSVCADKSKIYILSNATDKKIKQRSIDVYSAENFTYLNSIVASNLEDGLPTEIAISGDKLLILYDNNMLASYNLP